MMKQAKITAALALVAMSGLAVGQGYMAQSQAAINMNNSIQGGMSGPGFGGPAPVPGQVPGVGNPGTGFGGAPMGGNSMPGMASGMPGAVPGQPGMAGMAGQPQGVAAPTIETAKVQTGRRVFDAVSGAILEDAVEITVRQEDVASFDNGTQDNGLAGDGIRGNVVTSRNQFIGRFSNLVKDQLVHAVHNAEQIDPMVYYGYHVAKVNPTPTEGMKRYGLPLPGEGSDMDIEMVKAVPNMPSVVDLEDDRDDLVKRWNDKFLANYRVNPQDPQSDYFAIFVPSPPLTPAGYPVPNGYVAPQAAAKAKEDQIDAQAAAALATQASTAQSSSMGGMSVGAGGF